MKRLMRKAINIATEIETLYNKLDLMEYEFFDAHHDNLRIQMDCSWQEVKELEGCLDNLTKKYGDLTGKQCADICIDNLEKTLVYVKAVIQLQEQTRDLPTFIFG